MRISENLEVASLVDEGLGNSSYVVAVGGTALLVDPLRVVDPYQALVAERGWRLARVADTHLHADHVSGGPLLAQDGVEYLAPADAGVEPADTTLADGDDLDLGHGVRLRAVATPGHTPDHLAYVVLERSDPVAVFTGGSLMVGTVGRPDLAGDAEREALAHSMWHSLHERLLTLPDDTAVLPTHGAGSLCAAPGSTDRTTTIGRERATNPLLAIGDEDDFVAALLGGLGSVPAHFRWLPGLNRLGAPPFATERVEQLSPDTVAALAERGAAVVDTRPPQSFAAGHVPGSLANPLRPQFATWLGSLVEPDRQLVFVTDGSTDRAELLRQCAIVGFDRIAGELRGGIDAWSAGGRDVATVGVVDPQAIDGDVLDVRQEHEYRGGHLPGARNVPLGDVAGTDLPDGRWTVMCAHGERAITGASLLARAGHREVRAVLGGGADEWSAATGTALARHEL